MLLGVCLLLLTYVYAGDFKCSPGCLNGCEADYTCSGGCSENYHNDTSCLYCRWVDPNDEIWEAYIPNEDECFTHSNVIQKTSWLPNDEFFEILEVGETITFTLNQDSIVDTSFCNYKQKYRIGKWIKINMTDVKQKYIYFNVTKNEDSNAFLSVDVTNSQNKTDKGNCFLHNSLNETLFNSRILIPKYDPIYNPIIPNEENFYYVFINVEDYVEVNVTINFGQIKGSATTAFFYLTQNISDKLASDLTKKLTLNFPMEQYGYISKPTCIPNVIMKLILFEVWFQGNYSIVIDTRNSDRVTYIQEYSIIADENGTRTHMCVNVWSGTRHGVLADEETNGLLLE